MPEIILINPGEAEKNEWSDDLSLTEFGKDKTIKLAQIIATLIDNDNVAIFSSAEGDAAESAAILGETLDVEPEDIGYCCQNDISTDDIMTVLELISQHEATKDIIIFVISCPFLLKLLGHIVRLYHNIDTDIDEIEANCALFISMKGILPFPVSPDDDIYAEG